MLGLDRVMFPLAPTSPKSHWVVLLSPSMGHGAIEASPSTLDPHSSLPSPPSGCCFQGFRSLEDIRSQASLTAQQAIGLKHYDDFLERMPREEAAEIEQTVSRCHGAGRKGRPCYNVLTPDPIAGNWAKSWLRARLWGQEKGQVPVRKSSRAAPGPAFQAEGRVGTGVGVDVWMG